MRAFLRFIAAICLLTVPGACMAVNTWSGPISLNAGAYYTGLASNIAVTFTDKTQSAISPTVSSFTEVPAGSGVYVATASGINVTSFPVTVAFSITGSNFSGTSGILDPAVSGAIANGFTSTVAGYIDTNISSRLATTGYTAPYTDYAKAASAPSWWSTAPSWWSDPWATVLPGSYASGSAGYAVGHNLNAQISSIASLLGTPAGASVSADVAGLLIAVNGLPAVLLGSVVDGTLTLKQAQMLSVDMALEVTRVVNTGSTTQMISGISVPAHTAIATWYHRASGGMSANFSSPVAVKTTTYGPDNVQLISQTFTLTP